jgi:hypothetical protein
VGPAAVRSTNAVIDVATTDDPQMLTSYADYERRFGGLDVSCPMSYAVRDFYLNGGTMAPS